MKTDSKAKSDLNTELSEFTLKEKIATPKVSIIVPVYNTEKYLSKCLMSLIKQTLKEIEIIIVNDGSTDDSSSIISLFKMHDSRVKVINQENKLQGAARNNGMKIATGEYIGFVDSDDWVDLDYFEKLYNTAIKYNSDIALGTNVRIGNGKTKKRLNIESVKFVSSLQDKVDVCNLYNDACPVNKIYRLSYIKSNNITWPENVYCEDKMFSVQAVYYANGIVTVPDTYYYYFRRPNSTVNSKHTIKNLEDRDLARAQVLKFLKDKKAQLRDKDFWSVKFEIRWCGISWFKILVSFQTLRIMLFGIKLIDKKIKEAL